jgi:hypothetical protein
MGMNMAPHPGEEKATPTADTSFARLAGNPEKRRGKKTMNARVSIWFAKLGAKMKKKLMRKQPRPPKKSSETYKHTYIKTYSPTREDCDITASIEISRARTVTKKLQHSQKELREALVVRRERVGIFPVS